MIQRSSYIVVGLCCFGLLVCGTSWGQPALPAFDSPTAAGLTPLSGNIDVAIGIEAGGGGGTREVGWDSIGFDPVTRNAEFIYFGFGIGPWCVDHRKVVSQNGVQHSQDGYLTDQGNEWQVPYTLSVIGLDPGFDPGVGFGGIQGDDTTGDYIFTSHADELDTPFGLAGGWKGYVENTLGGGNTLTGAGYYPNQGDDVCVFQRLDRDGNLVTPLTAGRNIPLGNINAGVDISSGSAWTNVNADIRIGGCAILSNGNNFYNVGDRSNKGTLTFHGGVGGNTTYGTISDAAGAFINTTTGTHPTTNSSNPDGPVVSAGNGYFVNGSVNTTVMLNDMTIIYSADTNTVFDGSDPSLFPAAGDGGWTADDDETIPEAGPDIIYIPGRYTSAAGDNLVGIARYQVDVGAQTVTPLPILTPMDDLTPLPDSVVPPNGAKNGHTTHCDTNANGDVAIVYRNPDDNTVIGRIYNADGTARTGSFYVSATGAADNLQELYSTFDPPGQNFVTINLGGATEIPFAGSAIGGNAGKGAHSRVGFTTDGNGNDVVGYMWLTTSSVPSANTTNTLCNGELKALPVSHAARIISLSSPSRVTDWDLY